jgi:hypothetical protein
MMDLRMGEALQRAQQPSDVRARRDEAESERRSVEVNRWNLIGDRHVEEQKWDDSRLNGSAPSVLSFSQSPPFAFSPPHF